ncbi:aspartate aminotransferase family protein [Defluviicoccus vanus]|uniref:Acetylornithine aminotransferase n=1 Tax=Defluviicoccus vanus TaxID=111831 RepID=A0A7H1N3N3_9PROT|nr:aspartate aminotransferase family protein [Defluviicoccus vanus]QNT70319.1 aspartate aminotransferase family protein [Defluviicoccus vanus]
MQPAVMATYDRFDLAFEKGEGPYLFATNGRRYLDFGGGVAVTALGHCHPHLVAALERQGKLLWHCSNLYRIPEQERLAARLTAATFADAAFFCNSGAEAVECGIKLVRKFHDLNGAPDRYRIIGCEGSFHGRTLATIAAGASPKYREGYAPDVDGFDHVPFGHIAAVEAAITPQTAAILVEPVQGEGGINVAPAGYLKGLRALADRHGLLLFFDEIQCGMGRTGRLFAYEWDDVAPDLMAVAKGLGGGFPIGGCLATAAVASAFSFGSHGSTFGGNPLGCAVANAVLDLVNDEGFLADVRAVATSLQQGLQQIATKHPGVLAAVRGKGLMLGLKSVVPNRMLIDRLQQNGLLAIPAADNVVRLLPPLIIGAAEVNEAVRIIEQSCTELAAKAA